MTRYSNPRRKRFLKRREMLDSAGIVAQEGPLRQAAGQEFYNASPFTLRSLLGTSSRQQLTANFEVYLDGFSSNVQDILNNFEFRNQIQRLSAADALGTLIEKFVSPDINLSPKPVLNADGSVRTPGLDNHAMGTIFEDLLRRFNEENNEEAGEHWTPRDAVQLMSRLVFDPIADRIQSTTYLLYDGALGTGGMLTVAEQDAPGPGGTARQGCVHPPVRAGDKRRDVRDLQGGPAHQGRGQLGRQHRGRDLSTPRCRTTPRCHKGGRGSSTSC